MGLTWRNSYHILLMLAPNLLVPYKLYQNLRQPIHEFIHTRHEQVPLDGAPNTYLVRHYLFSRLVTVDIIKNVEERSCGEYYGHCDYFPQTFNLVKRIYVESGEEPNLEEHIKKNINQTKDLIKQHEKTI